MSSKGQHPNITYPMPAGGKTATEWIDNEEYCANEARRMNDKGDSGVEVWHSEDGTEVGVTRIHKEDE